MSHEDKTSKEVDDHAIPDSEAAMRNAHVFADKHDSLLKWIIAGICGVFTLGGWVVSTQIQVDDIYSEIEKRDLVIAGMRERYDKLATARGVEWKDRLEDLVDRGQGLLIEVHQSKGRVDQVVDTVLKDALRLRGDTKVAEGLIEIIKEASGDYAKFIEKVSADPKFKKQLIAQVQVPVGTVMAYAGSSYDSKPPPGWVWCDGTSLNGKPGSEYEELFKRIGDLYGKGNGKTPYDFSVPDYRGKFLRGVDTDGKHDKGLAERKSPTDSRKFYSGVGSVQAEEFKRHKHLVGDSALWKDGVFMMNFSTKNGDSGPYLPLISGDSRKNKGRIGFHEGGKETRPVNVSVNWMIKVK